MLVIDSYLNGSNSRSHPWEVPSTRPISYNAPSWINQKSELSTIIVQLSKDGLSPSEIGIRMRDNTEFP